MHHVPGGRTLGGRRRRGSAKSLDRQAQTPSRVHYFGWLWPTLIFSTKTWSLVIYVGSEVLAKGHLPDDLVNTNFNTSPLIVLSLSIKFQSLHRRLLCSNPSQNFKKLEIVHQAILFSLIHSLRRSKNRRGWIIMGQTIGISNTAL